MLAGAIAPAEIIIAPPRIYVKSDIQIVCFLCIVLNTARFSNTAIYTQYISNVCWIYIHCIYTVDKLKRGRKTVKVAQPSAPSLDNSDPL